MRSSWSPSADGTGDDVVLLRRRFVEAARRAEIIALVNRASTEAELADAHPELCEAFDAEFAFLLALRRAAAFEPLGSTGMTPAQMTALLDDRILE